MIKHPTVNNARDQYIQGAGASDAAHGTSRGRAWSGFQAREQLRQGIRVSNRGRFTGERRRASVDTGSLVDWQSRQSRSQATESA